MYFNRILIVCNFLFELESGKQRNVFVYEFDLAELYLYLFLILKFVFRPNSGLIQYI